MSFADEENHYSRSFRCAWHGRGEDGRGTALRIQRMARTLAGIDRPLGALWPLLGPFFPRPGDPGPILDMSADELGELIEERYRFDTPPLPDPVGPTGYHISLQGPRDARQGGLAGFHGFVGASKPLTDNTVTLTAEMESPLWRDRERSLAILHALIDAWEPECAIAFAFLKWGEPIHERPWLAWTGKPLEPRPVPPFDREYPYPWLLDDAGAPAEVRELHGGEVSIWP